MYAFILTVACLIEPLFTGVISILVIPGNGFKPNSVPPKPYDELFIREFDSATPPLILPLRGVKPLNNTADSAKFFPPLESGLRPIFLSLRLPSLQPVTNTDDAILIQGVLELRYVISWAVLVWVKPEPYIFCLAVI